MTPLVSIIIPTFNRAHIIGETLDSIIAQTYTNWECIVVDDGSTDETANLMVDYQNKDKRIQYHRRPDNLPKGANACRNYGFELSKGEYVNWFDSDDLMFPSKIKMKLCLLQRTDSDFVVSKGALNEERPKIVPIHWPLHLQGNVLFNHICGRIAFVTNGPLFKREFLNQSSHLFDERLMVRQEWEFFNRLLMMKPRINIIEEPQYYFRTLDSGVRRSVSYQKTKSKILAERLTLKNLKGKSLLSSEENLIHRKQVIRRCNDFISILPTMQKLKVSLVFLQTLVMAIDLELIKFILSKKIFRL